ncbi:MAG: hypothetical protein JWO15_2515 [Sphingomonadales bacterium]|nr:hypothetical protein [Sphingomonadales bacterium]
MKIRTSVWVIAGALAFIPAALAQTADPAPMAPRSAAVSVSDADVQKFAVAAVALNSVQQDASIAQAEKPAKMVAAVQRSGLDPQKFNAIAQAAEADPLLQKKIQVAAAAAMPRSK